MDKKLLAGSALAVAFLALGVAEQDRPWKRLQAEWRELLVARLRPEVENERTRLESSGLAARLQDARRGFEESDALTRPLRQEVARTRHATQWGEQELARLRAERRAAGNEGAELDEEIRAVRSQVEEARRLERDAERRLEEFRPDLRQIEERWSAESGRFRELEGRLRELERGFLWRLPVLRGLDPGLAVHEVAPPGLFQESPLGLVDRCATCHLGALGSDFEVEKAPFAGHPRSDLYVGEGSPHPYSRFGCTVCHGGEGRATDFTRAGHWSGEREASFPAEPILPLDLIEVGCARCHSGEVATAAGVSLELGRRTVLKMGCAGCHEVDDPSVRDAVRQGPPLGRIARKTTPGWAFRWIEAPRRFRATTWMPHLLDETASEAERTAEIRAMVYYLWQRSERPVATPAPSPAGDAAGGEKLFDALGCAGCHLFEDALNRADVFPELERLHGPNLARTGNKVNAAWLYAWLRDPRAWRGDTPMPNLRLSEQEAADLAAFLMASRDPAWEGLELPPADPAARDDLVRRYLEEGGTIAESAARRDSMDAGEKDLFLGKRGLVAYGCAGCHEIPGLEDAAPSGGPLGSIGARPRRFLDGDSVAAVAHRRDPRRRGTPDYGMSRAEADAVRVALLSWRPGGVEPGRRAERGERAEDLAVGWQLLGRFGCLGCHELAGRGGALATQENPPPTLTSTGARLKSSWLFAYLNDPGSFQRRPWLAVRMPSFDLRPEETNSLVRFFAAHDEEPLFVVSPPEPTRADIEVGRAVAAILQCDRCHVGSAEAGRTSRTGLAPAYEGARQRLRPDWVVEWILDPSRHVPGTSMPASFAPDAAGTPDSSFLIATVSAPMFEPQLDRLLPLFESEEELYRYLGDARQVASALRDYLWTR